MVPEGLEPWPDNDPEEAPAPAPAPPAAPLPEAPASVNVRVTLCDRECQITLRDSDEARLLTRLQTLLAQYPVPQASSQPTGQLSPQQHNAAAMHRPVSGFCAVHNVEMKLNDKNGRQWFSHRTAEGQWCKGR
jgi:hypothetical protein